MFDILNDFTTASVAATSCTTCPSTCNDFSMENLSLIRATLLEEHTDLGGEVYALGFAHSSQDSERHDIQERLFEAVVVKKSGSDDSDIAIASASLQEMLTSESLLYIEDDNENAYAHERDLYISGLKDSSKSEYNEGDGTLVITAKNDASGYTIKVTLKKAAAEKSVEA
ncbi:hypothetical protein O997_06480 [Anaplasma phagocytophilum str. MRK]|uniref:hypothetical protein n=1 Tax=Anaplasma phagocytophilum TaxID=948 RepID=UPI0005336ED7|nr:hypothetical protein [Anaplasma phagocytophilum]KDB55290.1 hypothetical protein O997_06480 [Anaplasma phagocytophilum str. MRK]